MFLFFFFVSHETFIVHTKKESFKNRIKRYNCNFVCELAIEEFFGPRCRCDGPITFLFMFVYCLLIDPRDGKVSYRDAPCPENRLAFMSSEV